MIIVAFGTIGTKMTSEEASDGTTLMLAAAAVQWFS
jgi:hypothetical protein